MPFANNVDTDQPALLHSLINGFVFHCLDSVISLVAIYKISRLSLASLAVQASLSLPCRTPLKKVFS